MQNRLDEVLSAAVERGVVELDTPAAEYLPELGEVQVLEGSDNNDQPLLRTPGILNDGRASLKMPLNGGELDGERVLQTDTVAQKSWAWSGHSSPRCIRGWNKQLKINHRGTEGARWF
jgi:CubicO group peptidase (beta-lactamase class C family)